jgi:hypothetical protein
MKNMEIKRKIKIANREDEKMKNDQNRQWGS